MATCCTGPDASSAVLGQPALSRFVPHLASVTLPREMRVDMAACDGFLTVQLLMTQACAASRASSPISLYP